MSANRRVSVDALPSRDCGLSTDESNRRDHDIYYSRGHHSRLHSQNTRPVNAYIQSLIAESRTLTDEQGVFPMLNSIFAYVASNTAFFSESSFTANLTELMDCLTNLQAQQVKLWKHDMFLAIQGNKANVTSIRKLVRVNGFDLNSEIGPIPSKDKWSKKAPKYHTALTWASWQGNLSLVKCLLAEGASPNALTSQGLAAIHCCSMKNEEDNLTVLKYFLEHPRLKIDINFCNDCDGTTSLMYACSFGSYKIAEYLLQQNSEVNRQDCEGKSALYYAVRGGHLDLVKLLMSYNACVYLRDNENANVLHHLLFAFPRSTMNIPTLTSILTYLVDDRCLSVSNQTYDGTTVLHEACRCGLTDVVNYLLGKGAVLEAKRNGWETPLWTSVMGKFPRPKLIMLLLEKGANFEVRHCLGMTLVQYAKQVAKNKSLTTALEDAQRILRGRRMKALLAQRKKILSFATAAPPYKACDEKDPPYLFTPIQQEMTRLTENSDNNNNTNEDGHSSSEEGDKRPLTFEKVKAHFGERDLEACSSISSGSFPSESGGEEDNDVEIGGGGAEVPVERIEDPENDNISDGDMSSEYETSSLSENSSSSDENIDDDVDKKDDNRGIIPAPDRNESDTGENYDVDADATPSSSSSSSNNKNNVDECFERLLRKKRLLEEERHSYESPEREDMGIPVPQKIMCIRRSAVSLSDSD